MNKKIFFIGFYLVSILLVFSFSGCLSLDNSSSGYVGTSNVSYSVEHGQVNSEKEFSGNLFWYDPYGTISSALKDGKICEMEFSMGYDGSDRDFLIQFTKKRAEIFNLVVKYLSKQSSKFLTMENADTIEKDLLSIINKECKPECQILSVRIFRLENF